MHTGRDLINRNAVLVILPGGRIQVDAGQPRVRTFVATSRRWMAKPADQREVRFEITESLEREEVVFGAPRMEPEKDEWQRTVGMFDGDQIMKEITDGALELREEERRKARQDAKKNGEIVRAPPLLSKPSAGGSSGN
jgi:hypothetical protein